MTIVERNNKLKHFITCLKCRVSGKNCDDNCPTQYAAGNMGEIIENLEAISKAMEQEPIESVLDDIKAEIKRKTNSGQWSDAVIFGMQKAIAIIDKYKAESEGE